MPCLEISLPKISNDKKQALASALTGVFCSLTGHEKEIFAIRFFEYEHGQTAIAGELINKDIDNPYIHLVLYSPRFTRSVKQKLATEMTKAFYQATEQPLWDPIIHICEHPYDNVAVNGKLLSDAYEHCANREFYYKLPKD